MSLETVLSLGKLYRQSENSKDYHELINKVSRDVDAIKKKKDAGGNLIQTTFFRLPVAEQSDGSFTFRMDEIEEITDEDKIASLYYLNFKTSSKDSTKKYLFGDIANFRFFYATKKGTELSKGGNYILSEKTDKGSFLDADEEASKFSQNRFIREFRVEFRKKLSEIEKILDLHSPTVIHFDFNGKSWHELPEVLNDINNSLTNLFAGYYSDTHVYLDKYLHRTLKSAESGSLYFGGTPDFHVSKAYKTRIFKKNIDQDENEILDLLYAKKLSQTTLLSIKSIGIVALPKGSDISTDSLTRFLNRSSIEVETDEEDAENRLEVSNQPKRNHDDLFDDFIENDFSDLVLYDIILMEIPKNRATGVYNDLVEISSISRSILRDVSTRVNEVSRRLRNEAKLISKGKVQLNLNIKYSFLNILSDRTKNEKKYQSHLLKVLPQIYTDTYYDDPLLLPAFIEKVENNIRNDGHSFSIFKYDFYFLMQIQKQNNLMLITETKSYAIGKCLGIMARPFAAWRKNCPIKSFEKSYVGNLSRRIATPNDLAKFCDYLNNKLALHEKLFPDVTQAYLRLAELNHQFDERYNKHHCALGFFESYYAKIEQEDDIDSQQVNN